MKTLSMLAVDEKPLLLLVDDMPANLHVLAALLRRDYRLRTATSGMSALELCARSDERPDLVLLDVMLPDIDGIEVLRRLRSQPATADIPVILVSADSSERSQLDGLDLGADDYLTKPVVGSVLTARVRNLLARRRAEVQLRLAARVFEHSGEAIIVTDGNNRIVQVNPAFTRLTGYEADEVLGRNPRFLSAGRTPPSVYQDLWLSLQERGFWQGEMWDRHKDGHVYPKLLSISVVKNSVGGVEFYIANFSDISEQKAAEERIRHVAHHDALTGLPNRLFLQATLAQVIGESRRGGGEVAIMFIDLDRFKTINDTLGHHVGDGLLIEVGRRLRSCVRESDLVARLGGDEFVTVLFGHQVNRASVSVAEKLLARLTEPYEVEGHVLHSSPSIGISIFPHDGDSVDVLMKNADAAMYHAKAQGRNNYQFFDSAMNRATAERLLIDSELREAMDKGQLLLHYQPQVDPLSGQTVGVEALLRWRHPAKGMVPPDRFIPVAEETGLIEPLGEWVLDEACAQARRWRDVGIRWRVAVNLSLRQLRRPGLASRVSDALRRHGLVGSDMELEITESSAMQNVEATLAALHELRQLGVELAIDDFGTGHSSLSYLKLMPIQRLKLDRSFVKDIECDPNDAAICSATIALAHALGMQVVAEGVENESQKAFLIKPGCDVMQGWLFSKAMPADELHRF